MVQQYDLSLADPPLDNVGQTTGKNDSEQKVSNNEGRIPGADADFLSVSDEFHSLHGDLEVHDDDEYSHLSRYEAMEAQLRKSLMKEQENMMNKRLHEERDSMKNEATDIHELAVYFLVKSEGKSLRQCKAAVISVLLSFLVVAVQVMISSYLIFNIIIPTCSQDDDCPEGNYCTFDYDIYGDRMTELGLCIEECYYHNKFGRLNFLNPEWSSFIQEAGCEDEYDTLCVENISVHHLRKFCEEDLNTVYTQVKDACLRSVHCKDPDLQIESRYCDFVMSNRDVLDFMGVFILAVVGIFLVLNIYGDIASGRKQLGYLRRNVAPGLLKQICSTTIIVSSTYLPFLAVQATVTLMLGSPMLPQNIVLNALSIAFILEIDNVVGIFALKAMKIEEESFRQKLEGQEKDKEANNAMEYFIIGTCFVLFMYQIHEADKDRLKIGFLLADSLYSRGANETSKTPTQSCTGIMYDLLGTCAVVLGIFFMLNVLVAFYESCKIKSRFKIWQICLWKMFTLLSALFLCMFLFCLPLALEVIVKSTESHDIGMLDIYSSSMEGRYGAVYLCITTVSIYTVLVILMWQMEKRLIGIRHSVNEDVANKRNEEFSDEKQDPLAKAANDTTQFSLKRIIIVVIILSILAGLLGGLLPRMRNASCQFSKVEDCLEFKEKYPNCKVEKPFLIGDGKCNGEEYNTLECNYDNGDCLEFNANYPNCTVEYPFWIGDGFCQGDVYNTEECNWDGGDCLEVNEKYPYCWLISIYIGSFPGTSLCYEGSLNYLPQCGWDFGNCAPPESYLCMMDEEQVWDGEECLDFDEVYPNCKVDEPGRIGDGTCDEGDYNSEDCNFDGGDCDFSVGFICLQQEALTWDDSRLVALEMNADLVKIECQEQNSKVLQLANFAPVGIGVNRDEEGKWNYADGSGQIEYENWSVVQYSDGDCAVMSGGSWYKAPCSLLEGSAVYQSNSQIDGMNCVPYLQCPSN